MKFSYLTRSPQNEAIKNIRYTAKPCLFIYVVVLSGLGCLQLRGALLGNSMSKLYVRSSPPGAAANEMTYRPFHFMSFTLPRRSNNANVWLIAECVEQSDTFFGIYYT